MTTRIRGAPTAPPPRRPHLVGTLPMFPDPEPAIEWQLDELTPSPRRVVGGETGERAQWIVPAMRRLRTSPNLEVAREGKWRNYDDREQYTPRAGARVLASDIAEALRLADRGIEEDRLLSKLGGDTPPPLQIGVPSYLDFTVFAFTPRAVPQALGPALQGFTDEVTELFAGAEREIVLQLESPVALLATQQAPEVLQPAVAATMAGLILRQVRAQPWGQHWVLHPCWGDLGNQPKAYPRDAGSLVRLVNAVLRRWPRGHVLDAVMLPLSAGDKPPSVEADFYRPLRNLRLPAAVTPIAGIAHELQARQHQKLVRAHVEDALGRTVDVSTACGLGRRTPERAEDAITATLVLTDD